MKLINLFLKMIIPLEKSVEETEFEQKYQFRIKKHALFFRSSKVSLPRSINNFDFLKKFVSENNVTEILPFGEIFIILLNSKSCRDNILAIDKTGNVLWRIKPVPYDPPAYFSIDTTAEGDKILVLEGRGYFAVDPYTGIIERKVAESR